MRVAALVSGGKDSALALHHAIEGSNKIVCLVTMIPKRADSWMFHFPNIHLTEQFAEASDMPLIKAETTGIKEDELTDLSDVLGNLDVEGIVSGAIASKYQKDRIDNICKHLGLRSIAPIWGKKPERIMRELLKLNFEVAIIGVYAYGFSRRWLGRTLNIESLKDLIVLNKKHDISIVGEGGEYETLVLDAPYFKKKIVILDYEEIWDKYKSSGYLQIDKVKLVEKQHS